ncbi:MAG: sigma-70 family RNA polymerase sigma factor [Acidimicrobiia bacterium]
MNTDSERRTRFETIADEVFEPLQRYLRRRIERDHAEDVLADVMLTVWRRLDDAPTDRVLPWCYGIARRTLANERRGRQRRLRLVERLEAEPGEKLEPDPAERGADPELTAALDALSVDDREIIRLWAWEQLEPRDIAPILGTTVNAASLRLSRARSKLANHLTRQDPQSSGHEPIEDTREQL